MGFSSVLILLAMVSTGTLCEDHYTLLGITRGASAQQLKKAYKEKMVKYHPDRYEGAEKTAMNEKFNRVQHAFEILSDPEMRQIYDIRGDRGVEEAQKNRNEQEGWRSQQRANQERMQGMHGQEGADPLGNSRLELLDLKSVAKLFRRIHVYVVLFYKQADEEVAALLPSLEQVSRDYEGIFTVARINCAEEEELCREFLVYSAPKLLLFPSYSGLEGRDLDFGFHLDKLKKRDNRDFLNELFTQVTQVTEDFVTFLSASSLKDFEQRPKPKFVLFTQKSDTPLMWKTLSKEFKNSADFAIVKPSSQLAESLGVSQFPRIHFYLQKLRQPVEFTEAMKIYQIKRFIRDMLSASAKTEPPLLQILQPGEISSLSYCGPKDKKICLIFLPQTKDDLNWEKLADVFQTYYSQDPLRVGTLPKSSLSPAFITSNEGGSEATMLLYKGFTKMGKFFNVELNSTEKIMEIVNDYLSSIMSLSKMKEPLTENSFLTGEL